MRGPWRLTARAAACLLLALCAACAPEAPLDRTALARAAANLVANAAEHARSRVRDMVDDRFGDQGIVQQTMARIDVDRMIAIEKFAPAHIVSPTPQRPASLARQALALSINATKRLNR